jgi:hypothetical protein
MQRAATVIAIAIAIGTAARACMRCLALLMMTSSCVCRMWRSTQVDEDPDDEIHILLTSKKAAAENTAILIY